LRSEKSATLSLNLGIDSARSFYFAAQQLSVCHETNESLVKESPVSLADNVEYFRRLRELHGFADFAVDPRNVRPRARSPLKEVARFGANPGNLRMLAYVPASLQHPRPLVVILHGCGQTAAGYDGGAGWSALARRYGFALLAPEQQTANNANACFNWFNAADIARDRGEAKSIRQMVAHMVAEHGVDQRRIFVTGLSAGGAMTSVMLAAYPEVFASGAIIAGLPYGVASNVREALKEMQSLASRPARQLGDLVRKASHHKGKWPTVSVWHGGADRVVHPGNANEIVKQWLDVHGLPMTPMSERPVEGHPRRVWWNEDGETLVECYAIAGMAHGAPLGVADNGERYGAQGPFLIEAGISSSHHIAKFFGLTAWIREKKAPEKADSPSARLIPPVSPISTTKLASSKAASTSKPAPASRAEPKRKRRARAVDVGRVISRALAAAGLRK
jgi:poly(hydroxyalkanoate) depolymerase family esterase